MRSTFAAVSVACLGCLMLPDLRASGQEKTEAVKIEHFDADPGWEGFRNRLVPQPPHVVRQHFGYRATNYAKGAKAGEIGGWIQRSITPAYYGKPIKPLTLDDKISFSGRFAVRKDQNPSGTLFGLFNDALSRGWRTNHSLAVRIDGNGAKYWLFFEYGTQSWNSGCKGCFEGDAYQTTATKPFPADGTPHDFTVTYDPAGNDGSGTISFVLDGRPYDLPLNTGHRADGATFNRFGIWNQQTTGDGSELYFDDLSLNGERMTFDQDPKWDAKGNELEYEDRAVRPYHDFGFSPTAHAGGAGARAGEIGGLLWRDEKPAYYGRPAGPFSLKDRFAASGRISFTGAGSDSGAYFGWFDAKTKRENSEPEHKRPQRNILGVLVEGPSRVGRYFRPAYRNAGGDGAAAESGPVIRPDGQPHEWSIRYDPDGAGGKGQVRVTFDGQTQTLDLQPGEKERGATFDRFGFFNCQAGGHFVLVFLDDLLLQSLE